MRFAVAALAAAVAFHSAPQRAGAEKPPERTLVVAGQRLSVLEQPPSADPATFVAAPGSELERTTRAQLLTPTLSDLEQQQLGVAAPPSAGLHLVKVHRDPAGKLFLYRPCDLGAHSHTLVTDQHLWLLGGEPFRIPITRRTQRAKTTTLDLDTAGLPPFLPSQLRLRLDRTRRGLYRVDAGDEAGDQASADLAITPAAAAKLPIVIRLCRHAKVPELDFTPPAPAPR